MTTKAKGKEVKTATPKNGSINQKAEDLKEKAAEIARKAQLTVEERFNKLEEFQALERKHSKIKAKHQSLKVLKRSNDTMGAEICISAGSEEIRLNNATIVEEVLSLLSEKLEKLNEETENEVLNFVI
jgi:hypothetical protein